MLRLNAKFIYQAIKARQTNNYLFQPNCLASTETDKAESSVSSISSQNDLSTLNMKDKRKEEYLNPKNIVDPKKDKFQTLPEQNDDLKPTEENIERTSKLPDDSSSSLEDFAYVGLDKTKPEYPEIAEKVKEKADALKNMEVGEHELKPEGGFKTVPIEDCSTIQQEVGFDVRKMRDASKVKLRKVTGIGGERNINAVPESMQKVEDYFDVAREKSKQLAEKIKEKAGDVLEKVKETAIEIAEKGAEKERKENFEKNLKKSGLITERGGKDAKSEVAKKVDPNLGGKFFDS